MAISDVFHALSDPTRREILKILRDGDRSAGELAESFPIAKSTLAVHFNVLKAANLVVTARRGTTIVYSVNVSDFEEAVALVLDVLGPPPAAPRQEK